MTEYRTEIDVGAWRYCYDCRKLTLIEELVLRQRVTSVTQGTIQSPFSVFSSRTSSQTYHLVDVCITCEALAVREGRQRCLEGCAGIGSVALLLFGYPYVVVTGWASYLGFKFFKRYGWRIKRRVKQLRLTRKGE